MVLTSKLTTHQERNTKPAKIFITEQETFSWIEGSKLRFTGNNYLEYYLVINTVSADLCYTVKWKANFISYLNLNDFIYVSI